MKSLILVLLLLVPSTVHASIYSTTHYQTRQLKVRKIELSPVYSRQEADAAEQKGCQVFKEQGQELYYVNCLENINDVVVMSGMEEDNSLYGSSASGTVKQF